jgi:hypothetical protein
MSQLGINKACYNHLLFETMQSVYYNEPTELQVASCGSFLRAIVKSRDEMALRSFLSCGVSSNPSDEYGESLVHLLCRRGDAVLLQIVLDNYINSNSSNSLPNEETPGKSLFQVSSFMGRTPLHEVCCAVKTSFAIVDMILLVDPYQLFMSDGCGYRPLDYVSRDQWEEWNLYLDENLQQHFQSSLEIELGSNELRASRTTTKPNCLPFPSPTLCLSPAMASLVASGQIPPNEASSFVKGRNNKCSDDEVTECNCETSIEIHNLSDEALSSSNSSNDYIDNNYDKDESHRSSVCYSVDDEDLLQFLETYHGDSIGCLDDCSGYADIVFELSSARRLYDENCGVLPAIDVIV